MVMRVHANLGYMVFPMVCRCPLVSASLTLRVQRRLVHLLFGGLIALNALQRGEMHVILRDTSKGHDFLEAILQAEMLTREVHGRWASAVGDHCSDPGQVVCKGPIPRQDLPIGELEGAIKASLRRTSNLGPLFRHELQRAGWCTQRLVLEGSTNRATW